MRAITATIQKEQNEVIRAEDVPVMLVRGEHDGIASEEDLLDFFRLLPNPDRQFVVLPGAAHALVFGHNRHQLWHVVHAFLTMPPRRDRGAVG